MNIAKYKDQLSVYQEVIELAKTRRADSNMMAKVMLESEMANEFAFYNSRAMQAEDVLNYCIQKQAKLHG